MPAQRIHPTPEERRVALITAAGKNPGACATELARLSRNWRMTRAEMAQILGKDEMIRREQIGQSYRLRKHFSDEDMYAALRRVAGNAIELSRPAYAQGRYITEPSPALYESRFGSWGRACMLAGLMPTTQPPQLVGATTKWDDESLVQALVDFLDDSPESTSIRAYEQWRTDHRPELPPAASIRYRMKSWNRGLQAARRAAREKG